MALKKIAIQFGMGTDLRGEDYTKAACRALRDALWHNALNAAELFGFPKEAMVVEVKIGVAEPDQVSIEDVAAVLPYGSARVEVAKGGLDIPKAYGEGRTIMANAVAAVYFDMQGGQG